MAIGREELIEKILDKIQEDSEQLVSTNPIFTRYMTLSTFCTCLKNDSLRFSKPSTWKENYDVFEDLLSSVQYEKGVNKAGYNEVCTAEELTGNYYAQCWNLGDECEAMWKSHTGGLNKGIMIKLKLKDLIKLNVESFNLNKENSISLIKVNYASSQEIVKRCEEYLVDVFDKGCRAERYVDFFKLKRKEFKYEKEYRFLIELENIREDNCYIKGFIEYIDQVIFSPNFDNCQYEYFRNKLISEYNIAEDKISKSKMFDLDFHLRRTKLSKI